jgi:hypothetical protein
MHSSSTPQRLPQSPQFVGLLRVSTHAPPQKRCPIGHIVAFVHAPEMQSSPIAHAFPHAPQFMLLPLVSTQVVPHNVVPGVQAHLPAMHACPSLQRVPQSPQLLKLLVTSVHVPPQTFAVVGHAHLPATHAAVAPLHIVPQVPQLRGSFMVSVQKPPQVVPVAQVQTPDTHFCSELQDRVHIPQAALSELRSRQMPPQFTRPIGQPPSTAMITSAAVAVSPGGEVSLIVEVSPPLVVSPPVAVSSAVVVESSVVDESTSVVSAGTSAEPPQPKTRIDPRRRYFMAPQPSNARATSAVRNGLVFQSSRAGSGAESSPRTRRRCQGAGGANATEVVRHLILTRA